MDGGAGVTRDEATGEMVHDDLLVSGAMCIIPRKF
jgi:hypothetical protein